MSCIHFKFKSSLDYEKITFDGLQISLAELKEAIMKMKKIGLSNEFSLEVVDSQSKKKYDDDTEMIPRNSSVIIRRIPIPNAPKIPKTQHKDPSLFPQAAESTQQRMLSADDLKKTADLANANASEEDKIMAMMSQSGEGYDPSQYVKFHQRVPGPGGVFTGLLKNRPPPNYVCYRCGQRGHWIKLCPTNGDPNYDNYRFKRSLGIPSSQISMANPGMPGTLMDRYGNLVMRTVDYHAVQEGKAKGALGAPKEVEIPPELTCSVCKELVKDAVIIPCCGESFCDECIREHLLENDFICPACKETDVSPDTLAPNKALRTAAKKFASKIAEEKSVAVARGFVRTTAAAMTPHQTILNAKGLGSATANSLVSSSSKADSTASISAGATTSSLLGKTVATLISKAMPSTSNAMVVSSRTTPSQATTLRPTLSQPTPSQVTTSRPTPSQATTLRPTPSQPTYSHPTPSQPAPSQSTTSQPTPSQPTPSQATTSQATTSQPTHSQATPSQPTPPAPSQPTSSQPAPSQPTPSVSVASTTTSSTSPPRAVSSSSSAVPLITAESVSDQPSTTEAAASKDETNQSEPVTTTSSETAALNEKSEAAGDAVTQSSTSLDVPADQSTTTRRSRSPSPRKRSVSPVPAGKDGREKESKSLFPTTAASTLSTGSLPMSLASTFLATQLGPSVPVPPSLLLGQLGPVPPSLLVGQLAMPRPPLMVPGLAGRLPGLTGLPTASTIPTKSTSTSSTSKLERIAADLLLSSATSVKKSSSPPPLTAHEFYRQQKMLKQFVTKKTRRHSNSPLESSGTNSRSRSSSLELSSYSDTCSSRSSSLYSRSRSRSISPESLKRRQRAAKKYKQRDRNERYEKEREREREREKEKRRHHKHKRKRVESPEAQERQSKRSKRRRSKSPKRKVSPEPLLSPEFTTSTTTSEAELKVHKRKHKKKRHRQNPEDKPERGEEMEVEKAEDDREVSLLEEDEPHSEEQEDPAKTQSNISLVPYQDSSATEVEQGGEKQENGESDTATEERPHNDMAAVPEGSLEENSTSTAHVSSQKSLESDELQVHTVETIDGVDAELDGEHLSQEKREGLEEGELSDSEEEKMEEDNNLEETAIKESSPKPSLPCDVDEEPASNEVQASPATPEVPLALSDGEDIASEPTVTSKGKVRSVASAVLPVQSEVVDCGDGHKSLKRKHKHKSKEKHEKPKEKHEKPKEKHEKPRKKHSHKHHRKSSKRDKYKY